MFDVLRVQIRHFESFYKISATSEVLATILAIWTIRSLYCFFYRNSTEDQNNIKVLGFWNSCFFIYKVYFRKDQFLGNSVISFLFDEDLILKFFTLLTENWV